MGKTSDEEVLNAVEERTVEQQKSMEEIKTGSTVNDPVPVQDGPNYAPGTSGNSPGNTINSGGETADPGTNQTDP